MKTLILVDIQNDFLPGGSLAVKEGDQVIPVANRLMTHFDLVIATQDWHPANHLSFASQHPDLNVGDTFDLNGIPQIAWPDHCVQGTAGAIFSEQLNQSAIQHVIQKGTQRNIDSYSGFFDNDHRHATGLDALLRSKDAEQVYVMGLATDYCVQFTALDAVELGYTTYLVQDGCRGVELIPGDIDRALQAMASAGIQIVRSEDRIN